MALKWLFARVNPRVRAQVRVLGESFVAKLTTKRPIPRVSSDMIAKMWRFPKGLLAVHALKSFLLLSPLFLLWWRQRCRRRRKWKGKREGRWIVHGLVILLVEQRRKSFLSEPAYHVMRFHLWQVMLVKPVGIHCSGAKLTVAASAIWKVSRVKF